MVLYVKMAGFSGIFKRLLHGQFCTTAASSAPSTCIKSFKRSRMLMRCTVSIPAKRTIHFQRSSDILIMPPEEIAMRKARFTEHQIIAVLKSVEAGRTVKDICREAGISEASYYNWKAKYGVWRRQILKR